VRRGGVHTVKQSVDELLNTLERFRLLLYTYASGMKLCLPLPQESAYTPNQKDQLVELDRYGLPNPVSPNGRDTLNN
jgi:hypothetical protein